VADLEAAGYITRTRTGRRTRYTVNPHSRFRHPAQEGLQVGPFLALLAAAKDTDTTRPGPDDAPDRGAEADGSVSRSSRPGSPP
jgi:hypothetical protein